MFERINRVKCSYGNPANFPRSARESLYACRGVTGGGGGRPSSLVSHEREQLEILSFRIKIRTRDRINHKPSLRVLNLISPINGIHGFRRVRIDKHGDAGGRKVDRACYRVILRGNSSNFPRDRCAKSASTERGAEKITRDRRKVGAAGD